MTFFCVAADAEKCSIRKRPLVALGLPSLRLLLFWTGLFKLPEASSLLAAAVPFNSETSCCCWKKGGKERTEGFIVIRQKELLR